MNETILRDGIEVLGPLAPGFGDILTPEALEFVASLARSFGAEREMLLERRVKRQAAFDRGELPDFLEETASIRSGEWRVASPPADLLDRRVEITGPVDRKMVINALNSGARMFMADFEDSNAPTWRNWEPQPAPPRTRHPCWTVTRAALRPSPVLRSRV